MTPGERQTVDILDHPKYKEGEFKAVYDNGPSYLILGDDNLLFVFPKEALEKLSAEVALDRLSSKKG